MARAFQARAMPTSYLIDRQGVVRFVHFGFVPSQVAKLEAEIQQLLAE